MPLYIVHQEDMYSGSTYVIGPFETPELALEWAQKDGDERLDHGRQRVMTYGETVCCEEEDGETFFEYNVRPLVDPK